MVKCADCGFLTLRDRSSGALVEVIDDYRVSGRVPPIGAFDYLHNYPICFAMAWNLMQEVKQAAGQQFVENSDDWSSYVRTIIQKDRACPPGNGKQGFTDYQQGFTPKEHREMLDRQEDREWRERQRKEDVSWRKWELLIIGGVVTGVSVIAQIVAAYIGRGSLP